jgi:hypothetical protein
VDRISRIAFPKETTLRPRLREVLGLATVTLSLGACGHQQGFGNPVYSRVEAVQVGASDEALRWADRIRPRDQRQPVPVRVRDVLKWSAPAGGSTADPRENGVYILNGYLRSVTPEATGELVCELSADESPSGSRIVTAIPPTETKVQERLKALFELKPGWKVEWRDETAPHVLVTGLPFVNPAVTSPAVPRWEFRPVWQIVVLRGQPKEPQS